MNDLYLEIYVSFMIWLQKVLTFLNLLGFLFFGSLIYGNATNTASPKV